MTLLVAEGLARRYTQRRGWLGRARAVRAVDGVSISIARNETVGLVGESGCGKSTTGRLVLGLEAPDDGHVSFDGAPMPAPGTAAWRASRARMQMVFQDPLGALDRRLTVAQQVREPLDIHAIGTPADRGERVAQLLSDVGLRAELATRFPHELSGGQRQRAVLARALATAPDLIVADEPISALDVSIQAQVVNLLAELQEKRGLALLFVSHDLKVVRQISHRVAVMYLGRVVEEGVPDEVFAAPAHPYTRALVAAVPVPGRQRGGRALLQGDPPNPADRPDGCAFHPRCPMAQAVCRSDDPALRPVGGRQVACHFAEAIPLRKAA